MDSQTWESVASSISSTRKFMSSSFTAILSKCAQPYDGDAILPAVGYSINEGRLQSQVTKYVGDVIFPAV